MIINLGITDDSTLQISLIIFKYIHIARIITVEGSQCFRYYINININKKFITLRCDDVMQDPRTCLNLEHVYFSDIIIIRFLLT